MFFQQLTKDPKDYHDVKSQPHAAVARRLNNSGKFHLKHGDIVKYIVCEVSLLVLIDRRAIILTTRFLSPMQTTYRFSGWHYKFGHATRISQN